MRSDSSLGAPCGGNEVGAALDAEIGRCLGPLRQFARKQLPAGVNGSIGADDLVQDAVLTAIPHLHHFEYRHKDSLLAYLRASIRHRIVDELRKARRRPIAVALGDHKDTGLSPLELIVERQDRERYSRAQRRLPDRDRQLIALRVEQGLAYQEIAERLGIITHNAARVAVRRALCRLRFNLAQVDSLQTVDHLE